MPILNLLPFNYTKWTSSKKMQPNNFVEQWRIVNKSTGLPLGVTDITEHVNQGNQEFHPNNTKENVDGSIKDKGIYFKDPETGAIYYDNIVSNKLQPSLNLSNFEVLTRDQIKQMYPKRDYIGGTPKEVRMKALDKIPWVKDYIKTLSETYNIDPNVLLHRFLREGYLDHLVQEYNDNIATVDQNNYFNAVTDHKVHGFFDLGLDDFGSNYQSGIYNLRRDIPFEYATQKNEKGRMTKSAIFNNLKDALEAKAADMEYRKNLAVKRGIPEEYLNTYVNAMYNLGVYHNDLNNSDFILSNYSVPTYFKSGGVFPDYLKMFNCDLKI